MGTYCICDECESFCISNVLNPRIWYIHRRFPNTDDAYRPININIDEETEGSADIKSQLSVENASADSQSDNDMKDADAIGAKSDCHSARSDQISTLE